MCLPQRSVSSPLPQQDFCWSQRKIIQQRPVKNYWCSRENGRLRVPRRNSYYASVLVFYCCCNKLLSSTVLKATELLSSSPEVRSLKSGLELGLHPWGFVDSLPLALPIFWRRLRALTAGPPLNHSKLLLLWSHLRQLTQAPLPLFQGPS